MSDSALIAGLSVEDSADIAAVWRASDAKLATLIKAGNLDPKTDFVNGDFRGWPLAGQDVRGIDFTGSDLRGTGIEDAIRDQTTILTGAILDDVPAREEDILERKTDSHTGGGAVWPNHWHAGVHLSFGHKFHLILVRFSFGSIFTKSSVVGNLKDARISDFMIFNLYSRWDILIRAWADDAAIRLFRESLKGNAEVSEVHDPRFISIEEVCHFPDRGKYLSVDEVSKVLKQTPTTHLKDAQEKGEKSRFYGGLQTGGLILDNETHFVNKRIQFYVLISSAQEPPLRLLRSTVLRVVGESKNIKSKSAYLAGHGTTFVVIKGQVQPNRYYDVYLFLQRLTAELQQTLQQRIETETLFVANQEQKHEALIDFDRALRDPRVAYSASPGAIVQQGEGDQIEFKSTLRTNLHAGQRDQRIELEVLKTIAAFVNSKGGTLIVGVADDGEAVGLDADQCGNEDKMNRHLVNLIRDRIGAQHMNFIRMRFAEYRSKRVLMVECQRGRGPIFVRDGTGERFFMRTGAATTELSGAALQDYLKHRF